MKAGHSNSIYFLQDALGSVRSIVNASGVVQSSYDFDERGLLISTPPTGVTSQKTYVGGASVQDETGDTGLYLMGHRWMMPEHGRFINRDPIGFAGGLNMHVYASNSPINRIDPAGLDPSGGALTQDELNYYRDLGLALEREHYIRKNLWKQQYGPPNILIGEHLDDGGATRANLILEIVPVGKLIGRARIGRAGRGPTGATGPGGLRNPCGGRISRGAQNGINVSDKGYDIVKNHVRSFGPHPPNEAMLARLAEAKAERRLITNGDANFFLHEASEATMMNKKGLLWDQAHPAALKKYGIHDFAVYPKTITNQFSEYFSAGWKKFWK